MDRRHFLKLTAASLASAMAAHPQALLAAAASHRPAVLHVDELQTLEAACDLLLPPVNGISVRDAGVVNFIDKLLLHEGADQLPLYRSGLGLFRAAARAAGADNWSALAAATKQRFLEQLEDGHLAHSPAEQQALFQSLRFNTLLGFLAAPRHGANQHSAGWQAIGFPGHLHYQGGVSDADVAGLPPH
ncbi:gluconate 2-dehydrogenase subunit 3 family protein [Parahaliea mediterranea]|uniref:gluconate 2-dehydrogenase subunit 3 family protein n=1 Tax=Parahaliea mediterranea TaxID=651086 RepID=UPI000E2E8F95|nr:gluconate 2-dehydrogenase subunit 3 family protein [Parahaliea mediterranea]